MNSSLKNPTEGNHYNRDLIVMTLPLFLMAVFFNGPRVIGLAALALLVARLTDRFAALLRGRQYDRKENSSVTISLIILLMLPATVPWYVLVMTILVALLVAKDAFGGFMNYPFNPAAVGFCVAAVSWPDHVLRYPQPQKWLLRGQFDWDSLVRLWRFENVALAEGPSLTLRNGGLPQIDDMSLLLGDYAGPMGVTCGVVVLACAVFLLVKGRLPLGASLAFLCTAGLVALLFPRYTEISFATWPGDILSRLQVLKFEILSGAMLFTAVFLVPEPSTMPGHRLSRIVYGALLGLATMLFRYFGTYELGACFAILLVNAFSGYFDRAITQAMARRAAKKGVAAA